MAPARVQSWTFALLQLSPKLLQQSRWGQFVVRGHQVRALGEFDSKSEQALLWLLPDTMEGSGEMFMACCSTGKEAE